MKGIVVFLWYINYTYLVHQTIYFAKYCMVSISHIKPTFSFLSHVKVLGYHHYILLKCRLSQLRNGIAPFFQINFKLLYKMHALNPSTTEIVILTIDTQTRHLSITTYALSSLFYLFSSLLM